MAGNSTSNLASESKQFIVEKGIGGLEDENKPTNDQDEEPVQETENDPKTLPFNPNSEDDKQNLEKQHQKFKDLLSEEVSNRVDNNTLWEEKAGVKKDPETGISCKLYTRPIPNSSSLMIRADTFYPGITPDLFCEFID